MTTKFLINASTLVILIATLAIGTRASAQGSNSPPIGEISIIYPTNGSVFTTSDNILLAVTNTGFEGLIDGTNPPSEVVQFFANSSLIGEVTNVLGTNVPNMIWTSVPAGTYTLVAVSSVGTNQATSVSVTITVNEETSNPATNPPPESAFGVGIIVPTPGSVFTTQADIIFEVGNNGLKNLVGTNSTAIEVVQFFANSNLVAEVTNGVTNVLVTDELSAAWRNAPAGTYTLVAVASIGTNQATSQPVTITINQGSSNSGTNSPPDTGFGISVVWPPDGHTFPASADIQFVVTNTDFEGLIDGTNPPVEVVQFFANSNLIGEVTNLLSTNVPNIIWASVPAGTYTLVAVASIGTNEATSEPVTITVNPGTNNLPPSPPGLAVNIGSPANGNVFTPPATIPLFALATETNADEVVQFFANSNLIATVTNIPGSNVFTATWTSVPVGAYALTAVVTTSGGDTATSVPVFISVNEDTNPPVVPPFGNLASPTNGSVYATPADIGLEETWSAGDPTASATVQFYANSNLIATVNSGPGTNTCFAAWTNVPAGSYSISAVLTYGSSTGSSVPVFITVNDNSPNGASPNVATRGQLPVVGVFPGSTTTGASANHVEGNVVYLSIGATSGMAYSLESSTDLINWTPVFTNQAVNGGAQYVAPNGYSAGQFYRVVPAKP